MGRSKRAALVAAPVLAAITVLAACNGGTSGPAGGSAGASPVAGVSDLCQPLAQAKRFRYSFSFKLESPQPEGPVDETAVGDPPFALPPNSPDFAVAQELDGAVRDPDKVDVTITTGGAGEVHLIFIGPDQWVLTGDSWIKRQAEAIPFPPVNMCDAVLSGLDLTGLTPTEEKIDGEKALRYQADGVALDTAVKIWTERSDMGRILKTFSVTVWLSKKGNVPLRIESKSVGTYPSGRQLTMVVTLGVKDINKDDIKVEPPS